VLAARADAASPQKPPRLKPILRKFAVFPGLKHRASTLPADRLIADRFIPDRFIPDRFIAGPTQSGSSTEADMMEARLRSAVRMAGIAGNHALQVTDGGNLAGTIANPDVSRPDLT
jgi:hypothetical protein